MNRGLPAVLVLAALLVGSGFFVPAHAAAPTVSKTSLPSGSVPVGLVYYGGYVYYASYTYGAIYKVDPTTQTFTYLRPNDSATFDHLWYGMAVDSSGNLWLTRRGQANNGTDGGVSVVSTSTGVETRVATGPGEWDGIGVIGGYAYVATGTTLFQISTTSLTNSSYPIPGGGGSYYGFVSDGSGNVWFSDLNSGQVCEFNGASVSCYSGYSRPLGLLVLGGYGYVAENNANGAYIKFSLSTGAPVQTVSVSGTTPYGAVADSTSAAWTSSGSDDQVCVVGPTALQTVCVSTGEENYYAVTDPSGDIFVSYYGSSGVAEIQGLAPSGAQAPPSPGSCAGAVDTGNLGTPTPVFTAVSQTSVSGFLFLFSGANSTARSLTDDNRTVALSSPVSGTFDGMAVTEWGFSFSPSQGWNTLVATGTNPYVLYDCSSEQAQPFQFVASVWA